MSIYVLSTIYWFCRIIEIGLIVYIIISWLPIFPQLRAVVNYIMEPLLNPVRRIIQHSVFRMRGMDISPLILYLVVGFVSQLCYSLR